MFTNEFVGVLVGVLVGVVGHSCEVLTPFLQYSLKTFAGIATPLAAGRESSCRSWGRYNFLALFRTNLKINFDKVTPVLLVQPAIVEVFLCV